MTFRSIASASLTLAFAVACGSGGDDTALPDAAPDPGQADAAPIADAAPEPDAADEVDADLSDHGFVEIDGTLVVFEQVMAYVNDQGIGDVTVNGSIGADCPLGDDCTTLYVTVPGDAELGRHDCDDLGVSVMLRESGGERFFSTGSSSAGCSFRLTAFGTEPGEQVAVEGLSAVLEVNFDPTSRRLLAGGELRATMQ